MKTTRAFLAVLGVLLLARSAVAGLWTIPVPLSDINTGYGEGAPFPTYDGLSLYFSRQLLPASPTGRLYSVTGPSSSGHFTSETEWIGLNAGGNVTYAWVSPDNLRLYYYQSSSARVIKMTQRNLPTDPWTAGTDVSEINALGSVANPSLTRDGLTIVFARLVLPPAGPDSNWDIWMGTRTDTSSPFGNFVGLSSVNDAMKNDLHPRLSSDGLTLYFTSDRNGADWQLFQATRPNSNSSFGVADPLSFFNSPGHSLQYPAISGDGQALYFAEATTTGNPDYDIYVSHAVPAPGAVVLGIVGFSYAGWRCRRRTA